MAINPIDLQTLFTHLGNVGKDQAVMKDADLVQQSLQGSQMAKKSEEGDSSVNVTSEIKTELEEVKEEGKSPRKRRGKGSRHSQEEDTGEEEREVLSDPDLGKHIDISG